MCSSWADCYFMMKMIVGGFGLLCALGMLIVIGYLEWTKE